MVEGYEDQSQDDLTEEASHERLRDLRRKGILAQSYEVSGLLVLITTVLTTYLVIFRMGPEVINFMKEVFSSGLDLSTYLDEPNKSNLLLDSLLGRALKLMIAIVFPVCISGFLTGCIASFAQIGPVFNMNRIVPRIEKINPLNGLKKVFSIHSMSDAAILCVKMIAVWVMFFILMKDEVLNSSFQINQKPEDWLFRLGHLLQEIFISLCGVFVVFSAFDFFIKKRNYRRNARTTRREALREMRDREGDPRIKTRLNSLRRGLLQNPFQFNVRSSYFIVTDGDRIALALDFDMKKKNAPKVVAKGTYGTADLMRRIGAEAQLAEVEDRALAHALFKFVQINEEIPVEFYQEVAQILSAFYRHDQNQVNRGK